jgi:hypothetical protein
MPPCRLDRSRTNAPACRCRHCRRCLEFRPRLWRKIVKFNYCNNCTAGICREPFPGPVIAPRQAAVAAWKNVDGKKDYLWRIDHVQALSPGCIRHTIRAQWVGAVKISFSILCCSANGESAVALAVHEIQHRIAAKGRREGLRGCTSFDGILVHRLSCRWIEPFDCQHPRFRHCRKVHRECAS